MSVSQQLKNKKRQRQKRKYERLIKNQLKKVNQILTEKKSSKEEVKKTISETQKVLDRSVQKGIIHKNNARHKKSKTQIKFNELDKSENA